MKKLLSVLLICLLSINVLGFNVIKSEEVLGEPVQDEEQEILEQTEDAAQEQEENINEGDLQDIDATTPCLPEDMGDVSSYFNVVSGTDFTYNNSTSAYEADFKTSLKLPSIEAKCENNVELTSYVLKVSDEEFTEITEPGTYNVTAEVLFTENSSPCKGTINFTLVVEEVVEAEGDEYSIDAEGFAYDGEFMDIYSAEYNETLKWPQVKLENGFEFVGEPKYTIVADNHNELALTDKVKPGNYNFTVVGSYKPTEGNDKVENKAKRNFRAQYIVQIFEKEESSIIVVEPIDEFTFVYDNYDYLNDIKVKAIIDGEEVELEAEDYTLFDPKYAVAGVGFCDAENFINAGEYQIWVELSDEFLVDHTIGTDIFGCEMKYYPINVKVEQREVLFDGYDVVPGLYHPIIGNNVVGNIVFEWTADANRNISMPYNGYSPMLVLTKGQTEFGVPENEFCLPNARFVLADTVEGHTGGLTQADITRGLLKDYVYATDIIDEKALTNTKNAGEHNVIILFSELSNYKLSDDSATASYTINPQVVSLEWKNTNIGITDLDDFNLLDAIDKRPQVTLIGLQGLDKYEGLGVAFEYYNANDYARRYPLAYPPMTAGEYIAVAKYVTNLDGYFENTNYVLDKEYSTRYIVCSRDSLYRAYVLNGTISTGAINNSSIYGLKLTVPTENEALEMIDYLKAGEDVALGYKLEKALEDGKNINMYVIANDVTTTRKSKLVLSEENCILVELKLYFSIDGDLRRYEVENTGDYEVTVKLGLSNLDAIKIGISNDRLAYIDRYHGDNTTKDYTHLVTPIREGLDGIFSYSFSVNTNLFSEFAVYTKGTPTIDDSDIDYNHIVPYTGE